MGLGPNGVVFKGCLLQGTASYTLGDIVTVTGDATVALAQTVNALTPIGVIQEDVLNAFLVAHTGVVFANIAFSGLVRVNAGAAVAIGDRVTNDATNRAVTRVRAIAGAQPMPTFGIALTSAAAAGQQIDVQLTPGATF